MKGVDSAVTGEVGRLAMQGYAGCAAALPCYFDLAPPDVSVPACSHRFHDRLFGGEARGVALVTGTAAGFAVKNLRFGENSRTEACSRMRPVERTFDALHFYHVDPGADYRRHFIKKVFIAPTRKMAQNRVRIHPDAIRPSMRWLAAPHTRFYCSFKFGGFHGKAQNHRE